MPSDEHSTQSEPVVQSEPTRFEIDPQEVITALQQRFAQRIAEMEAHYTMQIVRLELVIAQLTRQAN